MSRRRETAALAAAFLAVFLAVVAAYHDPAAAYELSVYRETPVAFWVGVGVAMVVSVALVFTTPRRSTFGLATGLAHLAFVATLLLPEIRGWYQVQSTDSLSHLGAIGSLADGTIGATDVLYPLLHLLSLLVDLVSGYRIGHNFHLVVVVFVVLFVLFVPLTTRLFATPQDRWIVPVGIFSGIFLLPIVHVHSYIYFMPSSQTVLFTALAFYLLVRHMTGSDGRVGVLLWLTGIAVVLGHPQQSVNLMLFVGAIAAVQVVGRTLSHVDGPDRTLLLQAVVLFAEFRLWVFATSEEQFRRNVDLVLASVEGGTVPAASARSRGASLQAIGTGLEELFTKLFAVSFLYAVVCVLLLSVTVLELWQWRRGERRSPSGGGGVRRFRLASRRHNRALAYLLCGLSAASLLFVVYVAGSISDQYIRHYAFLMVVVSIVGAVGLGRLLYLLDGVAPRHVVRVEGTVLVLVVLLLSMLVLFPSPYIYQGSDHATEAELTGYERAFAHGSQDGDGGPVPYATVRRDVKRYEHATFGVDPDRTTVRSANSTPQHFAYRTLPRTYDETTYLAVSERNRRVEVEAYDELRWSREDFAYLESEPKIDRVRSNGEFDLYVVHPRRTPFPPPVPTA